MRAILIILTAITLSGPAWAEQAPNADGRYLPGGTWQARNSRATEAEPQNPIDNPFGFFTEWGTDIRLTDFGDRANAHNPEIAASGNHIYVAWWYLHGDTVFLVQSADGGETWENMALSNAYTAIPQICASDSNVYVVYRGTLPDWGIYLRRSHDSGQTWYTSIPYYTARNYCESPVGVSRDSTLWILFSIEVDYVPPTNWDLFMYRSHNFGITFTDTFFVSDTTSSGIGPDMAMNCLERQPNPVLHLIRQRGISPSTQEILYERSTDGGESWYGPVIISDIDTIHSQWPQITAWGDSNVMASWMDYKYSHEAWTGDALISKSSDNGLSWTSPRPMTSSHMVASTDIFGSGDTVLLAYDDARSGLAAIYANVSYDGGITWEGEQRVSDTNERCIEPSVVMSEGMGHISWSDSRDNPQPRYYEIYYDRGTIRTSVEEEKPFILNDELSIGTYPNPFNSYTLITISNLKGGEAETRIYDIAGRFVKQLKGSSMKGGDIKAAWDATDTSGKKVSSGIYFARVSTPQTAKTLKLIFLK
jgi:hypothetical protein